MNPEDLAAWASENIVRLIIQTEIVEAKTAFGAWNKFKKRWKKAGEQEIPVDPENTKIEYISHEEIDG